MKTLPSWCHKCQDLEPCSLEVCFSQQNCWNCECSCSWTWTGSIALSSWLWKEQGLNYIIFTCSWAGDLHFILDLFKVFAPEGEANCGTQRVFEFISPRAWVFVSFAFSQGTSDLHFCSSEAKAEALLLVLVEIRFSLVGCGRRWTRGTK